MPTVQLAQGDLFYLEHRSEPVRFPPLVLTHGAGGSRRDWPLTLQQLPGAHVLTLDLPGHGLSGGSGFRDVVAYTDSVCSFLDALKLERAIIAGHSMGGAIAQLMAIHRPERTAGLILVGTGSKLPVEPTLPQRIIADHGAAVDWLTDWSWGVEVSEEVKEGGRQRLLEAAPEVLQGDYLACQAFDARPYLEQIAAPALVLGSDADRMVALKFSVTLAERIPHAKLCVVSGAGHNFPLEQPAWVTQTVAGWLAEQWG
jgi:pimeloyl-ACP methyl ester carboxylesterase